MSARRITKIALFVAVLVLLAAAYRLGVFARVAEPRRLADALLEAGAWGYLGFVVTYWLLQPFGVPGTIFVIAAPLIWPWKTAFALSMIGTMGASVIGFSFARFIARDWVSKRIPARFQKYEQSLEQNALLTVIVLRLIFWMPQALHFFLGVSKVRFWTHFWGSVVGYIPPLFVVSYLGSEMFDASGKMQPRAWPIMLGMVTASLVIAYLFKRSQRRATSAGS